MLKFSQNMFAQGIAVSENTQKIYLHILMNLQNLAERSHLMIKHRMMLLYKFEK